MIKLLMNFLNGISFGVVETVPGISGGTIAVILGFYDRLLESVNDFTKEPKKSIAFLAPFLIGIAIGIVSFASLINFLLEHYSLPTMIFFIGLIAGIIPIIFKKVKTKGVMLKPLYIVLTLIPIIALVIISHLKVNTEINPVEIIKNIDFMYMLFIFAAGIIAAFALIIPGLSGSFVLLLFGIYPLATHSISSIRVYITDVTNISVLMDIFKVLIPLAIGVALGGISMARLVEKLLKNYHEIIYSLILGLMIGSVYVLFKEPIVYHSGKDPIFIAISIITFVIGAVTSFMLGKKKM